MEQPLPVSDDAALVSGAVCEAASALGLKRLQLAHILGVSEPTVARLKSGQTTLPPGKSFELALLLIRVYRGLFAIVGGDGDSLKHWIKTPNHHFQGEIPAQLMQRIDGIIQVVGYLDAMRARA
ncbi:MAG: antitoxin Xre/MbcA/ParS toxin-binding domain-containing protein [Gammaproteobacteria bacterium]